MTVIQVDSGVSLLACPRPHKSARTLTALLSGHLDICTINHYRGHGESVAGEQICHLIHQPLVLPCTRPPQPRQRLTPRMWVVQKVRRTVPISLANPCLSMTCAQSLFTAAPCSKRSGSFLLPSFV